MTSRLTTIWSRVGELRMHAHVSVHVPDNTPAVVLVHGLGVSGTYLLPTAEELAAFYATYVPDLPGSGRSEKPDRVLDIPGLADALAAWVRTAGPHRATYVANSLGCQTVVDFALRYPEHIERAILIGPTGDPEARSVFRPLGRGLLDLPGEPLSLWRILLQDYLTAGPVRVGRTLKYAVADPLEEKLPRVRIPVLVVRGERDPIAPQRWVERMARLLPAGQVAVIPGAPHAANYAAPKAVARLVRSFMAQTTGPSHWPTSSAPALTSSHSVAT